MAIDPARLKNLFVAAIDIQHPESRRTYLDRECGSDVELRKRLEVLLAAHNNPAIALNPQVPSPLSAASESAADLNLAGQLLAGRYRLVERIAEGGMGTVWTAEQSEPVRRTVAVKLIKAGMDTRAVLARFEAERQALAVMDHPNIAKVLDGGITDAGRPFFVMEFVKGMPLVEYCDQSRLDIADRLKLFVQVCQAVQHAHQKGIIHRDLKPSNILVCMYDGKPVPKVIDFGLAKAVNEPLIDQLVQTGQGIMLGTPLYMSPEQAETKKIDVDTRSDIYSLGVILYELLTGTTPLEKQRFQEAAWQEVLRLIKEEDPPRPSDRLSGSGSLPSVAALRDVEPARLKRIVKGDLDWIVMKSLEKDRARRYDSANSFGADVLHYLAGEPVSAHPPGFWYRFNKFARRNRWQAIAASLVMLALVVGLLGAIFGLWQANEREKVASDSAKAERQSRETLEQRLKQLEISNEILSSIFRDVNVNDISDEDIKFKLGENLKSAATRIEKETTGDVSTVADLQVTLAESLQGFAHYPEAIELAQKAAATYEQLAGPDDPQTLNAKRVLATLKHDAGNLQEAMVFYRDIYERRKSKLGPDHRDTLISLADLASGERAIGNYHEAVKLFEAAWDSMKQVLGPRDVATLRTMSRLALAQQLAGNLDKSTELCRQALDLTREVFGAEHPETIRAISNLARAQCDGGENDQALLNYEEALKLSSKQLGAVHPETLRLAVNVGYVHQKNGDFDLASRAYQDALGKLRTRLGETHPYTLACLASLGASYDYAGKSDQALPYLEECLRLRRSSLRDNHPDTISSMTDLAWCYSSLDMIARALPLFKEIVELREKELGANHTATLMSKCEYGNALTEDGQYDEAIRQLEESVEEMKKKYGLDYTNTVYCLTCLGIAYREAGLVSQARETLELADRHGLVFGEDSIDMYRITANLAETLRVGGELEQATKLAEESYLARKRKMGAEHPDSLYSLASWASCLRDDGDYERAVVFAEEVWAVMIRRSGPTNQKTLWATANLAEILRLRGELDRALELANDAAKRATENWGLKNDATARCLDIQARVLWSQGEFERALEILKLVVKLRESKFGRSRLPTVGTIGRMGECYLDAEQPTAALPLLEEAYLQNTLPSKLESIRIGCHLLECYAGTKSTEKAASLAERLETEIRTAFPPTKPRFADSLEAVAASLVKISVYDKAEKLSREVLAIRETSGSESWEFFRTSSLVGDCLAGQAKYAEAEPKLLSGFNGLKQRESSIPTLDRQKVLVHAARALVELYRAWGKPEEAAKWENTIKEIEQ